MTDEIAAFNAARKHADGYAADQPKLARLLDNAERKADRDHSRLVEIWTTLQALLRLLKAWVRGQYRGVPWRTIIFATTGVLYFFDPLDLVPDPLPVIGYLDDATVLAFVFHFIRKDVERFLAWERSVPPVGSP